jgi:putative ABC transport system ATP-binding protein
MFWNRKRPSAHTPYPLSAPRQRSMIHLDQVVKTYQSTAGAFTALKGIDLVIERGEFVAIIGKSGSGKTTLINMLTGIDRPSDGEVYVADTPVHKLNEGQLAAWRGANMGIVFQFFQLLPTLTVLENVRLPMDFCGMYTPSERSERAMYLLGLVGIDPKILVTDEPTGNLDSHSAEQVFELLHQLATDGKTIVMVTHDSDLARRAGRTVTIVDGQIV